MKHRVTVCFLVLFLTVLVGTLQAQSGKPAALEVRLSILEGQVRLTRIGLPEPRIMTKSFPLYPKDVIETLPEAKAVLEYQDGTQMRMKPNTTVELQMNSLHVKKGKTWYKFTKRGSEFVISTPSLVAGIRGTEFDLMVTGTGKAVLSVFSGAVGVAGKSGEETMVQKGQAVNCYVNSNPTSPYNFPLDKKAEEWQDREWLTPDQLMIKGTSIWGSYDEELENAIRRFGPQDPRVQEVREKIKNRENDPLAVKKKQH
jgi:hypothetical protein